MKRIGGVEECGGCKEEEEIQNSDDFFPVVDEVMGEP
jgi:hypothetical protein